MTVLLDTVGLLALWDQSDQWHEIAQTSFTELCNVNTNFTITSFVLLECANAAARRPYRSTVSRLRQQMERADRLITPTPEDWQTAWIAYEKGEASSAGMVDHISFVVMRRLGISKAFTNDNHFRAAGFETTF
jgi:hypothetical protein